MQVAKKVLIACLPDPSGNPRPNRTIRLLHKFGYEVYSLSPEPKIQMNELVMTYEIKVSRVSLAFKILRKLLYYLTYISGILQLNSWVFERIFSVIYGLDKFQHEMKAKKFDFILVEDLNLLPFAFNIKSSSCQIVFDAREYFPKEFEGSFYFRHIIAPYTIHLLKQFLPQLSAFYTVSKGLSDLYYEDFGIRPEVIRSTPDYQDTNFEPLKEFPIKMVHHGVANKDRVLENMIEVVKKFDGKYCLDFYLTGDKIYINELKKMSKNYKNISFFEPVPFNQINTMLTKYDVGFYFLFPTGFNTTFNLPNKFFEFIQARIGMVIGPSPEMANLANSYGVALISEEFTIDSMVSILKFATIEQFNRLRFNSQKAAKELCWESESMKLIYLLEKNLKSPVI